MNTEQIKKWMGKFGDEYTERNACTLDELDGLYRNNYGLSRTQLNYLFIGKLDKRLSYLDDDNVDSMFLLRKSKG